MDSYDYLIIGGGMAADAAVSGIRDLDVTGRIDIVGQEEFPPYNRPPLTKGLWYGKELESIWRKTGREHVAIHLNTKIVSVDHEAHRAVDSQGRHYAYKKLLLATGGRPRKLEGVQEEIVYYRNLSDYYHLRELYDHAASFIIIGAGFIGTELAAALSMNGKKVTLIFKEPTIQSGRFPKKFSSFLNAYFTERDVQLVPKQQIASIMKKNEHFRVKTENGSEYEADVVIAALGIDLNLELAQTLRLEIKDGVKVNGLLETSKPGIWAAGDIVNFYSPHLDKYVRVEHEDAALSMGKQAGRNMAGALEDYTYLPFFYFDIFEIGYEAIGELSSDMDIIEDWKEVNREGSLFYLKEGKLRGAVFINTWNQIPKARDMIASQEPFLLKNA
jgi:3-phenylpropionate/trans-cinnamate dioxygenase ferredoxin reductase component